MTTRSGFMKSSIAAPSLRNSGLEQTANACWVSDRTAARTFSAVPTGTVDLVTTTLWPFMLRPISLATPSTCCRSAEPSSPGGVPTAMNTTRAARTADAQVGGEREAALLLVPAHHRLEPGLVDRDLVLLQPRDLLRVLVHADDVVAGLRQAGAGHQADVAASDHRHVHVSPLSALRCECRPPASRGAGSCGNPPPCGR